MSQNPFYTLDDFDFEGKTVLLRVDINSPNDPSTKQILDDTRIRAIVPTIRDLHGAKIVILAHQSKPGKNDFTPMNRHAELLSKTLGRRVRYVDSLFDTKALSAIVTMNNNEILLLAHTSFTSEDVALKENQPAIKPPSPIGRRL